MNSRCSRVFQTIAVGLAVLAFNAIEARACSGPGAAATMRNSAMIGGGLGLLAIAFTAAGVMVLRRRGMGSRIPMVVWLPAVHPCWWMGVSHGDCGHGLVATSLVVTPVIGFAVGLAVFWTTSSNQPERWRWASRGAFLGTFVGLLCAVAWLLSGLAQGVGLLTLFAYAFVVMPVTGAAIGLELHRMRPEHWYRPRLSLRLLLLLPVALAPLFVILFPVFPYEESVSTSGPFYFLIVDDATGKPVADASVSIIYPTHRRDDPDWQLPPTITGADGHAEKFLSADSFGRRGLLASTETTTYSPQLVQVDAPGYARFLTALANEDPQTGDQLTDPPLGITFPPPAFVQIRLKPADRPKSVDVAPQLRAK